MLQFDILVIGSGGAGMRAALEAGRQGNFNVALMTKTFPTRSATGMAQGGVNSVLKNQDPDDSIEKHIFDTVTGGNYLGDQDAIEFLCANMPDIINEMDYLGVPFSRDEKGRIAQRYAGGQSSPRVCFSADKSGHVIVHTLYEQCLKNGVKILSDWHLLDIVTSGGELCGVIALDMKTGVITPIMTKAIVVATGGAGRMYWLRTSNPFNSTGDGMAACFRAGIPLKDPEMVQFHPTGLASSGILMSEASRAEGGYLLNNRGERFMARYAPEKMELATRDAVSQAIENEIKEGRGFGEGIYAYVHLDLRHLGKEKILERLPGVRDIAMAFELVDIIDAPVPIRGTCHYSMGGIDVIDFKTCATTIKGIFAAGEAACVSVHGANRLGGNALAEILFYGKIAGHGAAACAQERSFGGEEGLAKAAKDWEEKFDESVSRQNGASVASLRDRLAETMWYNVGIFRTEETMKEAQKIIDALISDYQNCYVGDTNKIYNTAFVNYVELGNLLTIAKAVALGAVNRKESRGSHNRDDYPARDDENFLKHTIISKPANGLEYELSYRPVTITKYHPEEGKC